MPHVLGRFLAPPVVAVRRGDSLTALAELEPRESHSVEATNTISTSTHRTLLEQSRATACVDRTFQRLEKPVIFSRTF